MFPLKKRKLIRGAAAHVKAGLGIAADYEADYVPLYAPFDGLIEIYFGKQGGNWSRLIRDNGEWIEFAHLSKYLVKSGRVREGQQIAVTGNTGSVTTRPHKHIQIFRNGKRLDPEKYDWEELKTTFMQITVVANKNSWQTLSAQVVKLQDYFKLHSGGKIEIVADIKKTDFSNIPLSPLNGDLAVDVGWYRLNITPLSTGQISVFLMNPEDYQTGFAHGFMTYGDPGKPVRCELESKENVPDSDGTPHFVINAFHEICHAIFFLTGQADRVHEFLIPLPGRPKELLDLIDYKKLQEALVKIKPQEKIKIRYVGWSDKEKGYYIPADTLERLQVIQDFLKTQAIYTVDTFEYNLGKRPWK